MAVNATNRLVAAMDGHRLTRPDAACESAEIRAKPGAGISLTIEQLRYGRDVVTVGDDEGNTRPSIRPRTRQSGARPRGLQNYVGTMPG